MCLVMTPYITLHYVPNVCLYYKKKWLQEVETWFLAASCIKYITHPRFSEPFTGLIVTSFQNLFMILKYSDVLQLS